MSKIPEGILMTAEDVAIEIGKTDGGLVEVTEIIAKALMARDDRAENNPRKTPDEMAHDPLYQHTARSDLRDALMQGNRPIPNHTHRWAKNGRCTACGCFYAGWGRKDPCPGSAKESKE